MTLGRKASDTNKKSVTPPAVTVCDTSAEWGEVPGPEGVPDHDAPPELPRSVRAVLDWMRKTTFEGPITERMAAWLEADWDNIAAYDRAHTRRFERRLAAMEAASMDSEPDMTGIQPIVIDTTIEW
ncbi:hypothetical protein [Mariprofundus ferrooxydans]|uniref:hypothetical protein n=1 Tax=Mariprofundus ferrooxydans TaxID=314344 RepID=UPI001430FFEB|nr:hypothetical protein [Mariprofundus ferrooxydans]